MCFCFYRQFVSTTWMLIWSLYIYIYIYVYCLYFNPLALNLSSVLAPSHMRRAPYVRGATGWVLLLEYLINFLTCTYRSSWISILKEKKLINPTNHTCFKSIVNKAKPFFFFMGCCCCCCCCCCGFKWEKLYLLLWALALVLI